MRPDRGLALWLLAACCCGGAAADDSEVPDLEFLEYLGGLVKQEGEWVGPDDMMVARDANTAGVSDRPSGEERDEEKAR
jgi:hypothetical protein